MERGATLSSIVVRSTLLSFGVGLALLYVLTFTLPAHAQTDGHRQFGASTYTVAETDDATTTDVMEHQVVVTVTLSPAPGREVIIPITKTNEGGATNSDYSGVPASVTFASDDTSKTFTFTATADTDDDDEDKVKLSFGTLPTDVTAGTTFGDHRFHHRRRSPAGYGQLRRGDLLGGRGGMIRSALL